MTASFDKTDYYTKIDGSVVNLSSCVKRYGFWNPFVTKYGPHSVYNWEHDNLPLYDLEERTEYLWEKEGWSGSSLEGVGMALIVTESEYEAAGANRFSSLQDAIDALPSVIRLPIIIEVLKGGDLGNLDLQNIKFGKNGSLEIVNSCRIDFQEDAGAVTAAFTTTAQQNGPATFANVDLAGFETAIGQAESPTTDQLVKSFGGFPDINTQDNSATGVAGGLIAMAAGPTPGGHRPSRPLVSLNASGTVIDFYDANNDRLKAYDINHNDAWAKDATLETNTESDGDYNRLTAGTNKAGGAITGVYYNNKVRSIKVMNCDGPIYLRGFLVDGCSVANPAANQDPNNDIYYGDYGIEVTNTKKIVIENCAAVRSKRGGLLVKNSDVVLHRRFLAARNYDATDETARRSSESKGLEAYNSDITLSSDSICNGKSSSFSFFAHDYGMYMVNSNVRGVKSSATNVDGKASLRCSHNYIAGIFSISSDLDVKDILDIYENATGIQLRASNFRLNNLICAYNTMDGIEAKSSSITYGIDAIASVPTLTELYENDVINYDYAVAFSHNGNHNINLFESSMMPLYRNNMHSTHHQMLIGPTFSKDIVEPDGAEAGTGSIFKSLIKLNKSNMDLLQARVATYYSGGEDDYPEGFTPAFTADDGYITQHAGAIDCENSKLNLLGTVNAATIITGPSKSGFRMNGIYVRENSSCRVSGPTGVYNFNTGFVVDKLSTLEFSPHQFDGTLDYIKKYWDLDQEKGNHTKVEIRTTNTGIVVDNNSSLTMRDLGHSPSYWPDSIASGVDLDANYNTSLSACFDKGFMLIAPGTPGQSTDIDFAKSYGPLFKATGASYKYSGDHYLFSEAILGGTDGDVGEFRQLSRGGVLVQALNNSNVRVSNVNFKTGDNNADDVFYDPQAGGSNGCGDLRIWSFGTGATLDAAYMSVSSLYPSYAGYTGPRAVYYSSTDLYPSTVNYGSFRNFPYGFSGTENYQEGKSETGSLTSDRYVGASPSGGTSPYVSSLSVLDYFGSGTICSGYTGAPGGFTSYIVARSTARFGAAGLGDIKTDYGLTTLNAAAKFWGASGYENTGPFRLYLEPDPLCQYLSYMATDSTTGSASGAGDEVDTRPYQTISQGYHLSGSVSGPPNLLNTWRPNSLYYVSPNVEVSGYPDIAELVQPENYNIRLDESAAHSFANAKHCSIEFLGRPALVEIYRASKAPWGAIMSNASVPEGNGRGFKSPHIYDLRRSRG